MDSLAPKNSALLTRECTMNMNHLDTNWFTADTNQAYGLIIHACGSDDCAGTIKDVAVTSGSISKYRADIHFDYKGSQREIDEIIRTLQGVLDKDHNLVNRARMKKFYKHIEIKCGNDASLVVEIKLRHVFAI